MKNVQSGVNTVKRATVVGIVLLSVALFLLLRILLLQTRDYGKYEDKVIDQLTTGSVVSANRGKIFDSNGVVLATNVTTYRVFISPSSIKTNSEKYDTDYADLIAKGLSEILPGVTYEKVMQQTEYVKMLDRTIAREVPEETAQKVWAFINQNEYNDMIYTQATSTRYYPYSTLASNVLGTVGSGYGIEAQYNEYLTGTDGRYITARDSHGNELPYEYDSYIEAIDGNDVYSTINTYVQAALDEELEKAYVESGGKNRACGIVMDVNTGAILGMGVYPPYDLNKPRELDSQSLEELNSEAEELGYAVGSDEYNAMKTQKILEMWSNKAIMEPYMPGSTFKVMTASMAYEEDKVNETETFNCPGYYVVNGSTIHCHKTTGHGVLTFAGGIQQSCNPVLMQMGLRIGAEKFYDYFKSFGYRAATGIDLPGEVDASSLFWNRETFCSADIYLATASFGQNFKVTPIQQITAIASVANGGYLVTPHVVDHITDSNGNTVYSFDNGTRRQTISTETCTRVSEILAEGVAGNGGAKNAYVAGYRVAAKTGTSEKKDEGDNKYVCSCVAYAPADNAQYAALILVDEPTHGVLYGSVVAAPYISSLLETILPYLGVEAVYTEKELEKKAVEIPDLRFWGVQPAQNYAETIGIAVEFVGEGSFVASQSPAPGERAESSTAKMTLYLSNKVEKQMVTVPNLTGMTAVAANQTLAERNLNVRIKGTPNYLSGVNVYAYAQEPAAGTQVEVGTVVTVQFRSNDGDDDYVENTHPQG